MCPRNSGVPGIPSYDNLSRLVAKDVPGSEPDTGYAYDLLGRVTSETSYFGQKAMQYDLAGKRTRLTWPDGFYVTYDYNVAGDMTAIKENGSATLASFGYDNLGRRVWLARGNGTSTDYGYDAASRLASLVADFAGSTHDPSLGFTYNTAGQIVSRTASNDLFAWTRHTNAGVADTVNGLNQLVTTGGVATAHDARGNMTSTGTASYGYDSQNQLTSYPGQFLYYEPLGRLSYLPGSDLRIAYDGAERIAEMQGGVAITRRFVFGPGVDEPLVEYAGAGTGDKRWLHADERGSIVAVSDAAGSVTAVNRYDEYGQPQGTLTGRFGYTGQAWLPEVALWYYKARMYHPGLGRFMQADPIGFGDGMNWYDYTGGDPINLVDPTGLARADTYTGTRIPPTEGWLCSGCSGYSVGDTARPGERNRNANSGGSVDYTDTFREDEWTDGSFTYEFLNRQYHLSFGTLTVFAAGPGIGHNGGPPLDSEAGLGSLIRGGLGGAALLLVTPSAADAPAPLYHVVLPNNPSILGHIFRDAPGHYPANTMQARNEIFAAVRPENFVKSDRFGNAIFGNINANGTQTWVQVRGATIMNAGVNPVPINLAGRFK